MQWQYWSHIKGCKRVKYNPYIQEKYDIFTECADNTYGLECTKSCPKCKDSEQCDHVNGSCLNGCEKGIYGVNCDRGCCFLILPEEKLYTCIFKMSLKKLSVINLIDFMF